MQDDPTQPNINSWLEDELFQEYKHDRKAVDATWTSVLEGNGHTAAPAGKATAVAEPSGRLLTSRGRSPFVPRRCLRSRSRKAIN